MPGLYMKMIPPAAFSIISSVPTLSNSDFIGIPQLYNFLKVMTVTCWYSRRNRFRSVVSSVKGKCLYLFNWQPPCGTWSTYALSHPEIQVLLIGQLAHCSSSTQGYLKREAEQMTENRKGKRKRKGMIYCGTYNRGGEVVSIPSQEQL